MKVADEQGRTTPQAVIAGLDWLAAQRPRIPIAALALARPADPRECSADPLVAALARLRAAGTMVLTAAGNGGPELASPACSEAAVAVGAADTSGGRPQVAAFTAGWHGSSRRPDLLAPGAHVLGVLPADTLIARAQPTSQRADGLWRGSGTSEATAAAAGALAASLTKAATSSRAEPPAEMPFSLQPDPSAIAAGPPARSSAAASAASWSGKSWSGNSWSGNSWS